MTIEDLMPRGSRLTMRMEKRKNLEKKLFAIMIAGVLVVTSVTTTFAKSKSKNWDDVGGFAISGSNTVESTYGKGTTGGSAKPYKNYVVVSIYNKKNKMMSSGRNSAMNAKASKTLLGVNVKRTFSCHGVHDKNNNIVNGDLKNINNPR